MLGIMLGMTGEEAGLLGIMLGIMFHLLLIFLHMPVTSMIERQQN